MRVPERVLSALKREKEVLIAVHVNPDGDALGSALALSSALESMGKRTLIYSKDPVPSVYRFLPGHSGITSDLELINRHNPVLVLLDCNSAERAALERYSFRHSLIIDHHETEKDFGDIKWIDRNAAATGLMVFYLIKSLGVTLTKDIAFNLYTAIAVDTGTFRYSNTRPGVLRAGAELIMHGAEPDRIAACLYETWDRKRFNLLVMALNTLEIRDGIAMTYVTRDMFRKTGTNTEDTENFSNFPRMIDSVKVSAFFRETGRGILKVSLRSKDDFNVARIAECFEGGGHRNAAGFRIKADLKSAQKALLKAVKRCGGDRTIS